MSIIKFFLKWFGLSILVFPLLIGICALINAISESKHKHT